MAKIILIGGSPTSGKSYLAKKIAKELELPWISSDTIRGQMRNIVRKEDYPSLFLDVDESIEAAEKFLNGNSSREIVDLVNKEGVDVWKGVEAIIKSDYTWKSYVVEGVAILPHLAAGIAKENKNVQAVFLIDENAQRIRETVFNRGLWNDARKYPDSLKEKEVEWVLEFNEFIKREAKKFGFPVVSVGNRKDYLDEVRKLVLDKDGV